jgi:PAS domain S-box-containing protein
MGAWTLVLVATGGVCLAAGAVHLFVGLKRPGARAELWFGVTAVAVAGYCFLVPASYRAATIAAYAVALRWEMALGVPVAIGLAWFVVHYARLERRFLAWAITALAAVWLIANAASPASIVYREITGLSRIELPWGETLTLAQGTVNPWRAVSDAAGLLFGALVVQGCVALARRGEKRRAVLLASTLGLQFLVGALYSPLVDLGVVRFPYLGTLAFLVAIVVMGAALAREIVRASLLAEVVAADERRWHGLLENVRLLVVGIDAAGRLDYVNPHALEVLGYAREEALGRSYLDFTPARDVESVRAAFERAAGGEGRADVESASIARDGSERRIAWSAVDLAAVAGPSAGFVAIGADVTERRVAESARDRALREVENLRRQLEEENLYLKDEFKSVAGFEGIVGESPALQRILQQVEQVAPTASTVLVEGETGVGKELVARAVHEGSPRRGRPFVVVNCAALPPSLIESEMFGHERGSFTGATQRRRGRFELADGGSLFLDEVGELSLDLQPKLLRVLQSGDFERVGATQSQRVDVRVIAATNRDLGAEVAAGRFREDLYFRLHVFPIRVPPLRERRDDIPLLVRHFVGLLAARFGKSIESVPGPVLQELADYPWPGNVRELVAVLERAVITSSGGTLRLAAPLGSGLSLRTAAAEGGAAAALVTLDENERRHVARVLEAVAGRIAGPGGAAEVLGVNPSTLRSRMAKLGLKRRG